MKKLAPPGERAESAMGVTPAFMGVLSSSPNPEGLDRPVFRPEMRLSSKEVISFFKDEFLAVILPGLLLVVDSGGLTRGGRLPARPSRLTVSYALGDVKTLAVSAPVQEKLSASNESVINA